MSQHFIDDIKIENFKCFENLAITGFKRVNLFGGKNNVGKTALLEAIELFVKSINPTLLSHFVFLLLKKRQSIFSRVEFDLFYKESMVLRIRNAVKNICIKLIEQNDLLEEVDFTVDDMVMTPFNVGDFLDQRLSIYIHPDSKKFPIASCFVDTSRNDKDIAALYGSILESDNDIFLNQSLNDFDKSLISFKSVPLGNGQVVPKLKVDNRAKLVSLSEMGDGISRYVTILCAIWASQNGFLFIDEIENGIHYSNYKKLWELIFMASEQANCQVFVTSHSKECIDAFNQVQLERSDNTGMYFELYHSERKKRIVAAGRDAEQLHYSLTHGAAIRGE